MKRALVTGGSGFLGSYVSRLLRDSGVDTTSTDLPGRPSMRIAPGSAPTPVALDVTDRIAVARVLEEVKPDIVFHFAAKAYVEPSWRDPVETYRVNVIGTLNFLVELARSGGRTGLAFAGSGTEYGRPDELPTPETAPLRPGSPYASSKVAADLLCLQYFLGAGVPVYRYRIFGTTGPGKTGDATNDFASQIAAAERTGRSGVLHVGDLTPLRDISDVRDIARAMVTVAERGAPGEAYNIGSGETVRVQTLLDELVALSRVDIEIVEEASRRRAVDEPVHWANVHRLRALGFQPSVPRRTTLEDVLNHWRSSLESSGSALVGPRSTSSGAVVP